MSEIGNATPDWQPIATAPKDGTYIITVIAGGWRPAVSHWGTYEGVSRWGEDPENFMEEHHFLQVWLETFYDPTHWLPLPKPPVTP